jgi:hypothetical protein
MVNIYLIVMGIKRYINGSEDCLNLEAPNGPLRELGQVLIDHGIL